MPKIYWDIEQGSVAWFKLHNGIPTASEFDQIITPSKMEMSKSRLRYACRIVAARVLNWQADSLDKIKHIQEGKENEPLAVASLEMMHNIKTRRVGFVTTNDGRFGASPDRLVMEGDLVDVTVECKCPTIPTQFEYLLLGQGDAYRCQVQGQIYIAEAERAIFQSFNPRTPDFTVQTPRDDKFISKLKAALEQFSDELDEMDQRARSLGVYQAFAEIVDPVTAEYGDALSAGAEAADVPFDEVVGGDMGGAS